MRHALALAAVMLTPALAAAQPASTSPPQSRTIVVRGEGSAIAAPDMATLTAGVVSQADTARSALDANSADMARLLEGFRAAGIEERNIQTSGFSVQPRYVYPNRTDGSQGEPRIVGYEVRNSAKVKVAKLADLGKVLDGTVSAGANQIESLVFDIAEPRPVLDQARQNAVADARHRAELYARAVGVNLGPLRELSEQIAGSLPPRPAMMRSELAKMDVPTATGEQGMTVTVTAVWEIATP